MDTKAFVKKFEPYQSEYDEVDLNAEFVKEVALLSTLRSRSD